MNDTDTPYVYRAIPGFPSYMARNDGSILSIRNKKILRPLVTGKYLHVVLCEEEQRRIAVHVLIAMAWISERPEGLVINHKNGNGCDNRPGNLEWVTQSQNVLHAYANGLRTINEAHRQRAAALGFARRSTSQAFDCALRSRYAGKRGQITAMAKEYGISRDVIRRILMEGE